MGLAKAVSIIPSELSRFDLVVFDTLGNKLAPRINTELERLPKTEAYKRWQASRGLACERNAATHLPSHLLQTTTLVL